MGLHNAFYVDDEHCDKDEDMIIISIKRKFLVKQNLLFHRH